MRVCIIHLLWYNDVQSFFNIATPEVTQAGGINALAEIGQPADLLIKIKEGIFAL